jgi:hypothetical protein
MTVLTSTGAVNLTSATNWSPAQIPVDGDDLVIGAHTLTLDADRRLDSITLNNAGSRLAVSGTTRSVEATNGISVTAANSAPIASSVAPGTSLTLTGTWTITVATINVQQLVVSTGGDVTLRTVGADPSAILFNLPSYTSGLFNVVSSWTGGTLTTIGRFHLPSWVAGSTIATMSGGKWSHQSSGMNTFGVGGHRICSMTGTATINWTGSVDSQSNIGAGGFNGLFQLGSSSTAHTIGQSGDTILLRNAPTGATLSIVQASAGTVELNGQITGRGDALTALVNGAGAMVRYRNQSVSIPATDTMCFMSGSSSGTIDLSGIVVSNAGKFLLHEIGGGSTTVSAGTSVTNTTSSATACAWGTTALDGKIITLASDPPTLPAVQNVAAGTSYGYSGSPLTGTGVISDPAVIAAAAGSAMTQALNSISTTALARFVTVDTGQTAAADGSVAKLAQGGSASVDLTPVLDKLPLTGRAAKAGDEMALTSTVLTALFADVDTAALVASIVAQFDASSDLPVDTIATLAASRTVTALAALIADAAAAKTAAQSADGKLTTGRLSRVDALPTATAGTTGGLALHGATGGGAGDASQETVEEVLDVANSIAAALAGGSPVEPTGVSETVMARLTRLEAQTSKLSGSPVTVNGNVKPGGQIVLKHGDNHLVSLLNSVPVPVDDVGGSLHTLMAAVGVNNIGVAAIRGSDPASRISGTVAALNYASNMLTVTMEFTAAETAKGVVGPVYTYDVYRLDNPTRTFFSGKLTVTRDAR